MPTGKPRRPHKRMRVVQLAIDNAVDIRRLIRETPGDPELDQQMRDSSRSTADNAGEAEASIYKGNKRRALDIALRENNELAVQLCIRLPDNPDHPLHDRVDHVQRMLVCWKRRLE